MSCHIITLIVQHVHCETIRSAISGAGHSNLQVHGMCPKRKSIPTCNCTYIKLLFPDGVSIHAMSSLHIVLHQVLHETYEGNKDLRLLTSAGGSLL